TTLRRAKDMKALSPLTGLPGNIRIQEEMQRKVDDDIPFAVLSCDLEDFKAYNDHSGFARGDRVIVAASRILQEIVEDMARSEGFGGHASGGAFVVRVPPHGAE